MRRHAHSWRTLSTKLGFKRGIRRSSRHGADRSRRSRIETLEARQMLAGDLPEYVLAGWEDDDTPEQFIVSTGTMRRTIQPPSFRSAKTSKSTTVRYRS